jgi:predicted ATP-grasp superfamily ATP-dependent carboligase
LLVVLSGTVITKFNYLSRPLKITNSRKLERSNVTMSVQINSLGDVRQLIQDNLHGPVAWFGKRSFDAVGLEAVLGYLPLIISAEAGEDWRNHAYATVLMAIENQEKCRRPWATRDMDNMIMQSDVLNVLAMINGRLTILPYQTTANFEQLCAERGWLLLAPPMKVKRDLDKLKFLEIISKLKLPSIPTQVIDITKTSYAELSSAWGKKFVIQHPGSWRDGVFVGPSSGIGTFFVTDEATFNEALAYAFKEGSAVKVAKFIEGASPNVNFVPTRNGVAIAPPSYQIIGVPECWTGNAAGYCGNQWLAMSDELSESIYHQTNAFGQYLYQAGYNGIGGFDFISHYMLELNARVNGGTQTATQMALSANQVPLIALHILEMLGVDYEFDISAYNQMLRDNGAFQGFHLVLHMHEAAKAMICGQINPGVYKLDSSGCLQFIRTGHLLAHCEDGDEFVLNAGVPQVGMQMTYGATLLKINGRGIVYDPEAKQLTDWGKAIVQAVRAKLQITPME